MQLLNRRVHSFDIGGYESCSGSFFRDGNLDCQGFLENNINKGAANQDDTTI